MAWKQPMDTNLERFTQGNEFAATVMMELIRRAANQTREIYFEEAGGYVKIERGECVVGRYELARRFGLKRNESQRIVRVLNKLENEYKLIKKRRGRNCTIITILNYEELVGFPEKEVEKEEKLEHGRSSLKEGKIENSNEDYEDRFEYNSEFTEFENFPFEEDLPF